LVVIVLAYAKGGDVQALMAEHGGRLPERLAVYITAQMLEALHHLHADTYEVVLHRDVKPGNILLQEDKRSAWLADFGNSRLLHLDTYNPPLTAVPGTVSFTAPEILKSPGPSGTVTYNEKADIWALGATLFNMLTGETDNSISAILRNISPTLLQGKWRRGTQIFKRLMIGHLMCSVPREQKMY
jgi:serine/threonine protein kinase